MSSTLHRAVVCLVLVACAEPPDGGVAVGNPGKADFEITSTEGAEITEALLPLESVRLENCAGTPTLVAVDRDIDAVAGGDFVSLPEGEDYCAVEFIFAGPIRLVAADTSVRLNLGALRWELGSFDVAGQELNVTLGDPGWLTSGFLVGGEVEPEDPRHPFIVRRLRSGTSITGETEDVSMPLSEDSVFSGPAFVVVGDDGHRFTSVNGEDWDFSVAEGESLRGVDWGRGAWVAVGGDDGPRASVSADGETWIDRPVPDAIDTLNEVVWTGERFVAVGLNGVTVVSDEGWSWRNIPEAEELGTELRGVAVGDGLVVAVGANNQGSAVRVSNDGGVTWGSTETPLDQELYDLVFDFERWVSVGALGQIATSDDVVNWTRADDGPEDSVKLRSVHSFPEGYVAVGLGRAWRSADGSNWEPTESAVEGAWDSIYAADLHIVAAGERAGQRDGIVHRSANAVDWFTQELVLDVELYGVAHRKE